jgi:hypothetical protein
MMMMMAAVATIKDIEERTHHTFAQIRSIEYKIHNIVNPTPYTCRHDGFKIQLYHIIVPVSAQYNLDWHWHPKEYMLYVMAESRVTCPTGVGQRGGTRALRAGVQTTGKRKARGALPRTTYHSHSTASYSSVYYNCWRWRASAFVIIS